VLAAGREEAPRGKPTKIDRFRECLGMDASGGNRRVEWTADWLGLLAALDTRARQSISDDREP
jgi:hypothetical protein